MKTDITWTSDGMFVYFWPENEQAEGVVGQMITQEGTNKFESRFSSSIIDQLKIAGWIVRKKRDEKLITDTELLKALFS